MILSAGVAVLAAILVPTFLRARLQGQLSACQSNLYNIATACEMWSEDHNDSYPDSLRRLADNRYLIEIPNCPTSDKEYIYRLDGTGYQIVCPDSKAHRLLKSDNEPRFTCAEGPVCTMPEGQGWSWLWSLLKDAGFLLLFACCSAMSIASLSMRPEPPARVAAFLQRSPVLRGLSTSSWFLLVCSAWAALMWATSFSPLPLPLRLLLACWASGWICATLVHGGYRIWDRLSPLAHGELWPEMAPVGPRPGLSAGQRQALVLSPREKGRARAVRVLLPLGLALALLGLPALVPDGQSAARGSFLGLALLAILSWPISLWASAWARILTRRELEWLPGGDQLLLHSLEGGRVQVLGTVADIEQVLATEHRYDVHIGGEVYHLPPGDLGHELASAMES